MQSKKIILRKFSKEDLEKVIQINRTCLPENYIPAFFLDIHKNCPDAFIVGEIDGKVIGYIMCRLESGFSDFKRFRIVKKGHIVSIAVIPNYRRIGIGSALLKETLEALRKHEISECFMEVRVNNYEAIKLYRKINFEVVRRLPGYYQDGSDAYAMGKNLAIE